MMIIKRSPSGPLTMLACVALFTALFLLQPAAVNAQWTTPDASQNINNTNTGNVGIGTTTPTSLLEVKKSQNAATSVLIDNPFTTAGNVAFSGLILRQSGANRFHIASINDNNTTHFGGAGAVQFWNFAAAPMIFATNNTERMRVLSNGDFGIGTSTPGAKLHVAGGIYSSTVIESSHSNGFRLVVTGPGDTRATWSYDGGVTTTRLTSIGNVRTSLGSNGVDDRLFLDLAGNVGIGITSPLYKLDVNGGTNGFRTKAASVLSSDTIATFENNSAIQMIVRANGNVGIGNTSPTEKLHVTGNIKVSGNIDVGGNINAKYQDLAEWVESSQELPAGTVVVLDSSKSNQVVASTQSYDSRVAGVISPQPGIALGERGEGRVLVAATGRVKVKVDASNGPIQIGDLLVTGDKEGFAMKSVPVEIGGVRIHRPGTLIGKALEPLAQGTGEILVLLSLQ
jgi:hypothetical protein